MPRQATSGFPIEIIITAKTTYFLYESSFSTTRRIHTDGRDWPKEEEPTFGGYSIGKWSDTDGDGRYDTLEVETRNMKGPRAFDNSGIPLHKDNKTVVKERLFGDKTNPDAIYNEVTTFDNALTRPWTVKKSYIRVEGQRAAWREWICAEGNSHVEIGGQPYFLSAEGLLMPTKRGQAPPDLRYFSPSIK